MDLLPDLVGPRPRVVLCGLATVGSPRERRHYYAGAGNEFWSLLFRSGLTPVALAPEQDARVTAYGVGLTDLVRTMGDRPGDPPSYAVAELAARVERWAPAWLAFTSKTTAAAVAAVLGERRPRLGPAAWELGGAPVFVLPGTSGANRRRDYDGRPDRLSWWSDLASLTGRDTP